jgi:hypothetical protein
MWQIGSALNLGSGQRQIVIVKFFNSRSFTPPPPPPGQQGVHSRILEAVAALRFMDSDNAHNRSAMLSLGVRLDNYNFGNIRCGTM